MSLIIRFKDCELEGQTLQAYLSLFLEWFFELFNNLTVIFLMYICLNLPFI